jgi:S1-C subfamily serine protease
MMVLHPYMKGGIVLFAQQLAQMKNADIAVDDRVDIASVKIDADAPVASRAEQYLSQIKNPYAFKCGEIAVNVQFSPEGKTLKEAVTSYLSAIKKSN